ncbi:MAG: MBL fold metallo-hydrolase [Cellulosilyticaceae bacterium]
MVFRMCTIASGSSGNCTFVQGGETMILVDAGLSGKRIISGLDQIDVDPERISGILITHEHGDHIKGVGILSRKFKLPIYATEATWKTLLDNNMIGKVDPTCMRTLEKDMPIQIGELKVLPYKIYHDATDPVGYVFEYGGKKMSLATDLGKVDRYIINHIQGSHGILLEFNHDINMLEASSYPFSLKRRILGDEGHLCNELAAKVLAYIYHDALEWAILGHLSNENNLPDLAFLSAKNALEEQNIRLGEDIHVEVAKREEVSRFYDIKF